ncbi:hypothetical protein [Flavobacterium gelatinilyticum]|uniref:hypothetical protein n=1 Tax=Flavobacterium gelatinilyticum TaxID=3003260 RepID=UPI0024811F88|nr:hypothetical protein [Flavobacterium gelatinilyticum]
MSFNFTVVQQNKINTEPFGFLDGVNLDNPVPPLVSTKTYDRFGVKTLKISAILYVNYKDAQNPYIGKLNEVDGRLEINYCYDFSEIKPLAYDVWYIEIDYTSAGVENIKEVVSFLQDIDPITSRGTETAVSH